ncbi:retinol dehydrogenase 14-like [Diabrotica virgifera virgifera]|uniref:Retinol dehydrogenase 14-like n=1 Tax=Diabrotica virgifera virgifera TaxID=50390 RepID=A0ABM5IWK3_DIAVI|nr:retinol dehydrogenase 14-like [Diabrotica virgifera virgifera]
MFSFAGVCLSIIIIIIILVLVEVIVVPNVCNKRCRSKVCLVGKTALVTGGSSGMGYEIVLDLAQRGCRVIVADKIVSKNLRNKFIKETNNFDILVDYVDLGSFQSVRALAEKLTNREKKIDILIHNAGIGPLSSGLSADGINLVMQVNFYSPFLLTHLLVDLLKNSESARLVFCSSSIIKQLHSMILFEKFVISNPDKYKYSKYCLAAVADIFAKKLSRFNISSNCYDPGVVNTNIHAQFITSKFFYSLWVTIARWMFKSAEDGCQTAIYLACAKEAEGVTGQFFADLKPLHKPKVMFDEKVCQSIWDKAEKLVQLQTDEIL